MNMYDNESGYSRYDVPDDVIVCPRCNIHSMYPVCERTGGISAGKAIVGGLLLGPIGLLGGALGTKKIQYQCKKCQYIVEK